MNKKCTYLKRVENFQKSENKNAFPLLLLQLHFGGEHNDVFKWKKAKEEG